MKPMVGHVKTVAEPHFVERTVHAWVRPPPPAAALVNTRVALLYAGRWFGRAGQHFVDNHRRHLIEPAIAAGAAVSVFVVVAPDQWCSAAGADGEATLAAEVAEMVRRSRARTKPRRAASRLRCRRR